MCGTDVDSGPFHCTAFAGRNLLLWMPFSTSKALTLARVAMSTRSQTDDGSFFSCEAITSRSSLPLKHLEVISLVFCFGAKWHGDCPNLRDLNWASAQVVALFQ